MYQALYRKYRSKTFDELLGQKQVTIPLKNQIIQGQTSHAYLFSGSRGTGKTSAAKIFSRAVNCLHPIDGNPCNECENCKLILEDRMMDVVEMDAASNNGVDDIRELKERVVYPPGIGRYKVYIIDEVHMLSKGAFNALLKILEEPPKHLIFILATTELEKIPATIRSRCQRFQFRRLDQDTLIQGMEGILEKEGKSADQEALALIARHSQGAMRDALSLLEQCLYLDKHLTLAQVQDSLGLVEDDLIDQVLRDLVKDRTFSFVSVLNQAYKDGRDLERLLMDLLYQMKDLVVQVQSGLKPDKDYLEDFQLASWLQAMHALEETVQTLRYSKDPLLAVEIGFMDAYLAFGSQARPQEKTPSAKALDQDLEPRPKPEKIQEAPQKTQDPTEKTQAPQDKKKEVPEEEKDPGQERPPKAPKEEKSPSFKEDQEHGIIGKQDQKPGQEIDMDLFNEVKDYCKDYGKITIYALLKDAKAYKEGKKVQLVFEPNFQFHVRNLSSQENLHLITEAFQKVLEEEVQVSIHLKEDQEKDKKNEVVDFFGQDLVEKK
ncbi:DNA polymerase III, subunit gamma and tau [Peptoniphilus sp. oral taxon 375 str. F0436]|uniref:DNA polymerase III subunit gamma/tau n=1 Tax=Urinicoccus timonensis TaxID=2024205 RepID=UPI00021A2B96|nr:DNA polymerase III subunit gamma/tau [Urinicoccus timonensis]EGS30289.1 DNA polymerase III, subunit gamma and tau [Peptoniphilus sp. oral taxon 375 str. F0436]